MTNVQEKVQVSSDHEARGHKSDTSAGEVRPLLPAAPPAHQLPITRPFAVIHQIIPPASHIVFLRPQEIRRHLAPSLVSLVGSQWWWWWWWAMRRAGEHQAGRREGGGGRTNVFSNSYQFSPWLAAIRSQIQICPLEFSRPAICH